jgi:hypothetical protein
MCEVSQGHLGYDNPQGGENMFICISKKERRGMLTESTSRPHQGRETNLARAATPMLAMVCFCL